MRRSITAEGGTGTANWGDNPAKKGEIIASRGEVEDPGEGGAGNLIISRRRENTGKGSGGRGVGGWIIRSGR